MRKCGATDRGGTNTCCQDVISHTRAQKVIVAEMPISLALMQRARENSNPQPPDP